MVANWVKILLFVAGGVTAAGATAYVLYEDDTEAGRIEQLAAADPTPRDAEQGDEAPLPAGDGAIPIVEDAPGEEEQSAAAPAPADDQDAAAGNEEDRTAVDKGERLVPPSFDIVRVEPDGSMVIAGSAAPGADIEVVAGADVIARATAGDAGDFAAVLDEPLSPGDYQIVLRSTDPDDVVATSVETAVVSVPERESGQVLALVEEPGAPSKLITVPKAEAPAEEVAAAHDAPSDEEPAGEPAANGAAPAEPASTDDASAETAGDPAPEQDAPEDEASQPAVVDSGTGEQDAAQADAGDQNGAAGEGSSDETAAAPFNANDSASPSQPESQETGPEIALRGETEGGEAGAVPDDDAEAGGEALQQAIVAVEAVEIEGDTVYVAGRARPGMTVRVYANEILLGDSPVSEAGRFLVETRVDLPVGDYIVRADMLRSNGEVVARAAVPFSREPGERIAAVAPSASPTGPQQADDDAAAGAEAPQGGSGRDEAAGTAGDGTAPEEDASASAGSAAEQPAGSGDVNAGAPDTGSDEPAASDEDGKVARIAVQDESEADAATGGAAGSAGGASSQQGAAATDVARADPAPAASNAAPVSPSADDAEAAPVAVEQTMAAPLEPVDGSVIIRRGDTLWHISRRVYGRGIRYSTIYLANQDQIRDPDLIWPGQIFTVPDQTAEGEPADMGAIADQVVPAGEEETAAGSTQ